MRKLFIAICGALGADDPLINHDGDDRPIGKKGDERRDNGR